MLFLAKLKKNKKKWTDNEAEIDITEITKPAYKSPGSRMLDRCPARLMLIYNITFSIYNKANEV